jgi:hypothetical protein
MLDLIPNGELIAKILLIGLPLIYFIAGCIEFIAKPRLEQDYRMMTITIWRVMIFVVILSLIFTTWPKGVLGMMQDSGKDHTQDPTPYIEDYTRCMIESDLDVCREVEYIRKITQLLFLITVVLLVSEIFVFIEKKKRSLINP